MPHVIFTGQADLSELYSKFTAGRADSNGWIIKLKNILMSQDKTLLMFDCTAVRSGFSQDFYIRAEAKDNRLTVRVDPYMRIERNEGVQRTIVAIARWLQKESGSAFTLSKSNIPDDIVEADGWARGSAE